MLSLDFLTKKIIDMNELSLRELVEINGGGDTPTAYEAGHKVGDFLRGVVQDALLLAFFFLK